ncbi:hypothetical protein ACFPRL_16930 [Pseudoclavibacter helvolus]
MRPNRLHNPKVSRANHRPGARASLARELPANTPGLPTERGDAATAEHRFRHETAQGAA